MKIQVVALLGLSFFSLANAQSKFNPGGVTDRFLDCKSLQHLEGVRYGLVIQTQALAPEYSIRGAYLAMTEVYPGAVTTYTNIELQNQDDKSAFFNYGKEYFVILNKTDFTAQIVRGNSIDFICSENKNI